MELENKMLIDGYWLDYDAKDDEENEYEWLERIEEEEEEGRLFDYFAWSRENDGYRF
jgi:hypothetical protein